jgi:hypothetical protein
MPDTSKKNPGRSLLRMVLGALLLAGCAGMDRGCSSCTAEQFGADWVVVQIDALGRPFRCWALEDKSIANELHSDGVYWVDPHGNLVHISGHYNRVQVINHHWDEAYAEVGLTKQTCKEIQARRFDPQQQYAPDGHRAVVSAPGASTDGGKGAAPALP